MVIWIQMMKMFFCNMLEEMNQEAVIAIKCSDGQVLVKPNEGEDIEDIRDYLDEL